MAISDSLNVVQQFEGGVGVRLVGRKAAGNWPIATLVSFGASSVETSIVPDYRREVETSPSGSVLGCCPALC